MVYFISDTHFGHKGSLRWNDGQVRPGFQDLKEMEELMITNWNNTVSENDTVFFLGDFAYKCSKSRAKVIFRKLNGVKHLIEGNHDLKIASKLEHCWETISQIAQFDFITPEKGLKQEIIMCHYPMVTWRHKHQGAWHLHGHVHGSMQNANMGTRRYDCSVEVNDYRPISLEQLTIKIKEQYETVLL